jgi:hypothetical protein
MSPAKSAAISRACVNIEELAAQILLDAKEGRSPIDENGTAGMWLRQLEEQVDNLKIAAAS